MSLKEKVEEYGKMRAQMASISMSISAKERKIALLKEEYKALGFQAQALGWEKWTFTMDDLQQAMQKFYKNQDVQISVELPFLPAPQKGDESRKLTLHNMKATNNDWMKVNIKTRYNNDSFYQRVVLSDVQADGKPLEKHIVINKVDFPSESKYKLSIDDINALQFTLDVSSCVYYERGGLRFFKDYRGAVLKHLIEKEEAKLNSQAEGKEKNDVEGEENDL